MDGIVLRQYKPKDADAVFSLHVRGLKNTGCYLEDAQTRQALDTDFLNIAGVYLENHGEFLVATHNESIVGMGALRRVDEQTGEIKRMRVEPVFQRQGIGSKILDALIRRARELGYAKLILDTSVKQEAAQHLYMSRGFSVYKREMYYGTDTLFFEKIL